MKRLIILVPIILSAHRAVAAGSSVAGSVALPLATIIGEYDPALASKDKATLASLLDHRRTRGVKKIVFRAGSIVCRASDVDIAARSCAMTFGRRKVGVTGRRAHEIFANLGEAGVPSDGAAGTIFESVSSLRCVVDPREIRAKDGGGAKCTYKAGP